MAEERTLVSFDWAIKYLLKNKADYVILEGFLTTLLGREIKIQNLTDPEGGKGSKDERSNCIDVLAVEEDGSLILIELQFTRQMDYFHRMAFGSSKAITDHLGEGMPYSELKKVYSINIVYFDLGAGPDYIYHGTTTFKGLHLNDVLELSPEQKNEFAKLEVKDIFPEYYILKVDRFRNIVKSKLDEWMYYLRNSSIKTDFDAPGLQEADKKLEYSRLSKEDRMSYDYYVDKRRGDNSSIYTARKEGELVGKAQEKLDIAKKMKAMGMDIETICKVTALTKEEVLGVEL